MTPKEKWSVEFGRDNKELVRDKKGNDRIVVSAIVSSFKVKRFLIDSGSKVEVLSWETYRKMRLKEEALSEASPLYDFMNYLVEVKDLITLLVTLGDGRHTATEYALFYIMDHPMAYNAIFRKPIMRMARIVV
ncbi:hypothetical protein PVK06_040767 [Gossypium arboreum]|uniref:Uncharacterized protein n=1 Tax=Gossypium arboreum TaxID=29729 RepID=A0ABR0N6E7_GOSAR|nr:hypothetical protein PVK06_040767 [Gossypium arboreum]